MPNCKLTDVLENKERSASLNTSDYNRWTRVETLNGGRKYQQNNYCSKTFKTDAFVWTAPWKMHAARHLVGISSSFSSSFRDLNYEQDVLFNQLLTSLQEMSYADWLKFFFFSANRMPRMTLIQKTLLIPAKHMVFNDLRSISSIAYYHIGPLLGYLVEKGLHNHRKNVLWLSCVFKPCCQYSKAVP